MSGTQLENDGIIPQQSLTDWDEMEKTGNGRKCESVDIKRLGTADCGPFEFVTAGFSCVC